MQKNDRHHERQGEYNNGNWCPESVELASYICLTKAVLKYLLCRIGKRLVLVFCVKLEMSDRKTYFIVIGLVISVRIFM